MDSPNTINTTQWNPFKSHKKLACSFGVTSDRDTYSLVIEDAPFLYKVTIHLCPFIPELSEATLKINGEHVGKFPLYSKKRKKQNFSVPLQRGNNRIEITAIDGGGYPCSNHNVLTIKALSFEGCLQGIRVNAFNVRVL